MKVLGAVAILVAGVAVLSACETNKKNEPIDTFKTFKDCGDCPEMVVIPPGTFRMGDLNGAGDEDEKPHHDVRIDYSFAVGKYEVTRGQFAHFVRASGYTSSSGCWVYNEGSWGDGSAKSWRDPGFAQTDDHPVTCVNWDDANAYLKWINSRTGQQYRLLSEAEWEYVARAHSSTKYSFGNTDRDVCSYGNTADRNSGIRRAASCSDGVGEQTARVGRYSANAVGIHDTIGNVWEWVEDCWNDNYHGASINGGAWKSGDCSRRVLRGGAWNSASRNVRSAERSASYRVNRDNSYGFRIARMLRPEELAAATSTSSSMQEQAQVAALRPAPEPAARTVTLPIAGVFPKNFIPGDVFKDCASCPEMVLIPPGTLRMGDLSGEGDDDEKPVHDVRIDYGFAVGKYEVTRSQFADFVRDTGFSASAGCWVHDGKEWVKDSGKNWRDPGFTQTVDHPVACVNWDEAKAFIRWLSSKTDRQYRLLSEAEWEYVARAGSTAKYSFGIEKSELCSYGNAADLSTDLDVRNAFCSDGVGEQTAPVGRYAANAFGIHDLIGNVQEWTVDCWNDNYINAPTNGGAWMSGLCDHRVMRGGSWITEPWFVRSSFRNRNFLQIRGYETGFRVARTIRPEEVDAAISTSHPHQGEVEAAALGPVPDDESSNTGSFQFNGIGGEQYDGFARFKFYWNVRMSHFAYRENGKKLVLQFDRKVRPTIEGQLRSAVSRTHRYLKGGRIGKDRRSIVLDMKRPFQFRLFNDGPTIIIDIFDKLNS